MCLVRFLCAASPRNDGASIGGFASPHPQPLKERGDSFEHTSFEHG